ncbi:MAG: hypothetical protein HC872_03030 [Gammaproteobacteria bacterium]|nr:hypothetical protein [Gammaproteobacteria bacterium]
MTFPPELLATAAVAAVVAAVPTDARQRQASGDRKRQYEAQEELHGDHATQKTGSRVHRPSFDTGMTTREDTCTHGRLQSHRAKNPPHP